MDHLSDNLSFLIYAPGEAIITGITVAWYANIVSNDL
jgi:hypothetical protein